jgi:uroporphyrinogen-III synthase
MTTQFQRFALVIFVSGTTACNFATYWADSSRDRCIHTVARNRGERLLKTFMRHSAQDSTRKLAILLVAAA